MSEDKHKSKEDDEAVGKITRKILRVGDSGVVSLPVEFLRAYGLKPGKDYVEMYFDGLLIVRPLPRRKIHRKHAELLKRAGDIIGQHN